MAAILNSAFLDSAILPKTLTQTNSIWLKHIYSDSTWWWQPSRILPCWIPSSLFSHLSFSSQTHSHFPRLVSTICTKKDFTHTSLPTIWKKNFTHWFWLSFMMAAILNSAFLDSAILPKTLTQTNSIWLKHIYSDSTWWWQPSWILSSLILPSWIQPS